MSKVSLALSGGGARCISQLGFISFLDELGINIDKISGSSGGAIIAGLYASGMSVEDIFKKLQSIDYRSHLRYNIKNGSIYTLKKAILDFQQIFGKKDIRDFPTKFYSCLTNYQTGQVEYKDSGDFVTLILASSSLIPLFEPIMIEDQLYIDGGYCDNLPLTPLLNSDDFKIGINVNPFFQTKKRSFRAYLERSMFIMLNNNIKFSKNLCDLFVEIEQMGSFSIFDTENFELFYEIGYNEAKKYIDILKRLT